MATKAEKAVTIPIQLPLLQREGSGEVDQTVTITINGKQHVFNRGERVELTPDEFMILRSSGRFPEVF